VFDFNLKRAQVALSDGRLDEAYEVLKDSSLQQHRAGQKLITRLSKAFIQRGRSHLQAHRLAPALDDCLRAEKLAGNLPQVVELRSEIAQEIETERIELQQRAEQFEKAKQQMQNGWLSAGRKILAQTDDQQAQCLLKNVQMLEIEADSVQGRIQKALKVGQIEMAARLYQNSILKNNLDPQAAEILNRIQQAASKQLQGFVTQGDIHLATSLLGQLSGKVLECDSIRSCRQSIDYCRLAVQQMDSGNFTAAVVNLKKFRTLQPKAKWLNEAIAQTQRAADSQRDLQAGPLGILESIGQAVAAEPDMHQIQQPSPAMSKQKNITNEHIDVGARMRFLLQIDGVGAWQVLCDDRVTIGPVSGSKHCDIELVTAPDVRPQQIERTDGDYFMAAPDAVVAGQLLNDGQRLELSPRCRFKFSVPNPASSTACLVPSSARFPRADISGVILMDREILIGPECNNHIQTGQIDKAMTLFLKDKSIYCRAQQVMTVDGRPLDSGQALPMDKQIGAGDIRFCLNTYRR
jgi:uncharacterized protein Yka (UPF0111/DUF47 family)